MSDDDDALLRELFGDDDEETETFPPLPPAPTEEGDVIATGIPEKPPS